MHEPVSPGTVTPDDFRRIRQIFEAALERPTRERRALIEQACGGNTLLAAEVEGMLAAEEGRHSLLDRAAASPSPSPHVRRLMSSDTIPVGGFTPGTILGDRYRIIGLLGRGGMGEVYRADDLKLGQPVALKFLPADLASDAVRRERFYAEVRITRQLSHPNICRVYDIEEAGGLHFLSMEYIDGEDLESLIKRIGHLSNEKAIDLARQLVSGVIAAHERGVLHRDLKPANVMIDGLGRVRITDFGLAIAMGEEAVDASGTPAYMAPEQLSGKGASVRSDIYALGLVLYEVLTGKRAFLASTLADLREQKEQALRPPSEVRQGVDPTLERLIMRCVEHDPRLRPGSASQLAIALPGGDPLTAAIAAGETPSPGMVAALGSKEGLRPIAAWLLLGFVALGSVAVIAMKDRDAVLQRMAPQKPPDVLLDRARTIVRAFGYSGTPADSDYGVIYIPEAIDSIDERWRGFFEATDPILFWFRQSPHPLEKRVGFTSLLGGTSGLIDPPMERSGEVRMLLDGSGALRRFEAIPPVTTRDEVAAPTLPWEQLFAEANLDPARWMPDAPRVNPASFADVRAAWAGSKPDDPDVPLRVEAAAYNGRVVAVEVTDARAVSPGREANTRDTSATRSSLQVLILTVLMAGGAYFARRNVRLGRGDRRGATRLSIAVMCVMSLLWLIREHHVATFWEVALFVMFAGFALFVAALLWVLYVGLEPFVRRRWPNVLVSWTRVLGARGATRSWAVTS